MLDRWCPLRELALHESVEARRLPAEETAHETTEHRHSRFPSEIVECTAYGHRQPSSVIVDISVGGSIGTRRPG
jgi:hypothetical protein